MRDIELKTGSSAENYYFPLKEGGLGLKDLRLQGRASRPATLNSLLNTPSFKAFLLLNYFCDFQLSSLRQELRDNLTPSATRPILLYSRLLETLQSLTIPQGFSDTTSAFYSLILRAASTVPILPRHWSSFASRRFSLSTH